MVLELRRGKNYEVRVSREGYQTDVEPITRELNSALWWNFFNYGLALPIDFATGAAFKLSRDAIFFSLQSEGAPSEPAANLPVTIESVLPSAPNSVGGVSVTISGRINTDKVVKYVRITAEPYNRVGDVVRSEIGGHSTIELQNVGPYRRGQRFAGTREDVWYSPSITHVRVVSIDVEYMDGSIDSVPGPSALFPAGR